ncbi:hypothetical protein LZF95_06040 [Algoriphagus sp. AGSA1]|uniref:hypothetical protein n=1 Tax=Algoriphagus sp. AGSA1 TaxID=2907213 RepID=UPI001F3D316C|nr:hypothetical protein [Algoriphagus sp. AGSA1]MCE7054228.1 hypothetical protein [Algoriphagus sp. AGSA1]
MESINPASEATIDMVNGDHLPVITIVELRPKVPCEGEALDSLQRIVNAAAKFKGYQEANIYKKVKEGSTTEYAIILRFDHYINLRLWNNSLERKQHIANSKHFFAEVKPELALTGLDFWFVGKHTADGPPVKWKMMLVTVIIIFAMLQMVMPFLGKILGYLELPEFLNTLLSIMVMVSLMTYLIMPAINKLLYNWLFKNKR